MNEFEEWKKIMDTLFPCLGWIGKFSRNCDEWKDYINAPKEVKEAVMESHIDLWKERMLDNLKKGALE